MKKLKFNIKCPLCGSINRLDLPLDLLEEAILIDCSSCENSFEMVVPEEWITRYQRVLTLDVQASEFGKAQQFKLTSDSYTIGRKNSREDLNPDLEVLTLDKSLCGKHAIIRKHANGFTIQNIGVNGTWVNGERIEEETFLRDGDIIVMGRTINNVSIDVWDSTLVY